MIRISFLLVLGLTTFLSIQPLLAASVIGTCQEQLDDALTREPFTTLMKAIKEICGGASTPINPPEVKCCPNNVEPCSNPDGRECGNFDPRTNKVCICETLAQKFDCSHSMDGTLFEELFHALQQCARKNRKHPDNKLPPVNDRLCYKMTQPKGAKFPCSNLDNYYGLREKWCVEINEQCQNPFNTENEKNRSCADFCDTYESDPQKNKCCKVFCGDPEFPNACDSDPSETGQTRMNACCNWIDWPLIPWPPVQPGTPGSETSEQ